MNDKPIATGTLSNLFTFNSMKKAYSFNQDGPLFLHKYLFLWVWLILFSSQANAQSDSALTNNFEKGLSLFRANNFVAAIVEFDKVTIADTAGVYSGAYHYR